MKWKNGSGEVVFSCGGFGSWSNTASTDHGFGFGRVEVWAMPWACMNSDELSIVCGQICESVPEPLASPMTEVGKDNDADVCTWEEGQ